MNRTANRSAEIVFFDSPRTDHELLRVTLSELRGRTYIDLRVWYSTDGTEWKPSRAGVTLRADQVGQVTQALMLAARSIDPKEGC
ncbi:transcriptional coactivator p15/PC4 family protein [Paraburkholderia adhaesiva]|uniref:transcriptional coactivator p15/PC4 family protein n=1 Tax=Paraburkholderia adhaesiva TaxID=2883244 RepID=UPI001F17AFD1|nr:transcriptional coactivator p15/PC4 family protein [Paraburkholderia adhaesiva]